MKVKLIAILAAGMTLALTTHNALAYGSQVGAITVTPSVGEYFFDNDRQLENGTMPSLSLGYNFTNNFGVEAIAGRTGSDSNVSSDTVHANYFALDGLYRLTNCTNFEPFVMAGLGALTIEPKNGFSPNDPLVNDPRTQANVNGGVGIQYFFNNVVSLRTDVRDIYSLNNTDNSSGKNDVLLNVGLGFAFDAAAPTRYNHA